MVEKLFVDDILVDWEYGIRLVVMKEWVENMEELVEIFGKGCDDWIECDFYGWISVIRCVLFFIFCRLFFCLLVILLFFIV